MALLRHQGENDIRQRRPLGTVTAATAACFRFLPACTCHTEIFFRALYNETGNYLRQNLYFDPVHADFFLDIFILSQYKTINILFILYMGTPCG
jgi:hypothetical protein